MMNWLKRKKRKIFELVRSGLTCGERRDDVIEQAIHLGTGQGIKCVCECLRSCAASFRAYFVLTICFLISFQAVLEDVPVDVAHRVTHNVADEPLDIALEAVDGAIAWE